MQIVHNLTGRIYLEQLSKSHHSIVALPTRTPSQGGRARRNGAHAQSSKKGFTRFVRIGELLIGDLLARICVEELGGKLESDSTGSNAQLALGARASPPVWRPQVPSHVCSDFLAGEAV